jgi:FkbM family methyltransferase
LRRNLAEEIAQGRVLVAPVGAWDRRDVLPLYESEANTAADSFLLGREAGKVVAKVPLVPIDELLAEVGIGRVDLVKLDIKGSAARALKGAEHALRRDRPFVAVATEEEGDEAAVIVKEMNQLAPELRPVCGLCGTAGAGSRATALTLLFERRESSEQARAGN